ncbi:hypothetical protein [Kitasatospora griseola]|uniref:hypothetical protein n=1 Tax=Kitasatospora griseola TaxID=2064 RepID=UPI00382B38B2
MPVQQPEVVLGLHPDHGVVADLPTHSAAAAWMVERLEFQPVADRPNLYVLTEQHRELPERLGWAIKVLNGAGFTVENSFSPGTRPDQLDTPLQKQRSDRMPAASVEGGPDVAFAESDRWGLVAAVSDGPAQDANVVMAVGGWRRHPGLDIYFAPPGERADALAAVAATTLDLQRAGFQVAVEPHLAEAVAARRARGAVPSAPALNTSLTQAMVPAAPPAAVDPRVAFARAR